MEELFTQFAHVAQTLSEAAAVIVVTFGSVEAFLKLLWIGVTPNATHGERKEVWRRFGTWLLLGLEFELAADIVGSVVSPDWQDIGQLGAIAVIRTFLELLPRAGSGSSGGFRRSRQWCGSPGPAVDSGRSGWTLTQTSTPNPAASPCTRRMMVLTGQPRYRSGGTSMKNALLRALAVVVVLSPVVALAQGGKAKPTTATWITKEEVDTVNSKGQGTDRNIKVVDIGHENYTVGIIHRGKTVDGVAVPAAGAAANAAGGGRAGGAAAPAPTPCGRQMPTAPAGGNAGGITHDSQTEGYYIVSGSGTMFTDGYIVNGRHNLSPELNGPTCGGMAYDVVKKVVKPGDIIIIPAGVVHGWSDIPEHVDYLSFRPSPGILTAGWVHPVLRK